VSPSVFNINLSAGFLVRTSPDTLSAIVIPASDAWGDERVVEEWRKKPEVESPKEKRMSAIAESILRADGAYQEGLIGAGSAKQLQERWEQIQSLKK
jgi:hypothetical protein